MTFLKTASTVVCLAAFGIAFSPSAKADDWNKKTTMTFSGPVEIPGVHLHGYGILPAGTYVFKVLDSKSDRHIVQILSKDELTVYATILAIPNFRLKATDKTVMTFRERPDGQPEALRAWFYPGKEWGDEFVYPKARALALAKETHTPVLFTQAEIEPEVTVAVKTPKEPVVMKLAQAPVMAVQPTGEEVQVAEVVTAPPVTLLAQATPAQAAQTTPAPATPEAAAALPATASNLPLVALFGLLALAGAMIMGWVPKRA